jgi:hypothetical protein
MLLALNKYRNHKFLMVTKQNYKIKIKKHMLTY